MIEVGLRRLGCKIHRLTLRLATALLRHLRANPALIAALCGIVFAALITWMITQVSRVVGGRIDRAEEARNLAQAELVALNAELETRVQEEQLQMAANFSSRFCRRNFLPFPRTLALRKALCVFSVCIFQRAT